MNKCKYSKVFLAAFAVALAQGCCDDEPAAPTAPAEQAANEPAKEAVASKANTDKDRRKNRSSGEESQSNISQSAQPSWGSVRLPMMNSGSARAAVGTIHLYKVWLGRWDSQKQQRIEGYLETDLAFIAKDATFYDKSVSFEHHSATLGGFRTLTDNDTQPAEDYDTWTNVLGQAYNTSPKALTADVSKRGGNGWVLLVFGDQVGRSFSSTANGESGNMEVLIFYTRSPHYTNGLRSIIDTSGHVITHELLHVFGAIDLYPTDTFTASQANLAKGMWPDEIMIDDKTQPSFRIHGYTAYQLGWHDRWDKAWNGLKPSDTK